MKCMSETRFDICQMKNRTHLYYYWTIFNTPRIKKNQ